MFVRKDDIKIVRKENIKLIRKDDIEFVKYNDKFGLFKKNVIRFYNIKTTLAFVI